MEKKTDFTVKKTEYEWQKAIDTFYLTFVPRWYEFLNWIVLLAIFYFLSDITKDWKVKLIYAISNIGLLLYLQSYFFNLHIEGIPFIKSPKSRRLFSLLIGGIIATGVYLLIANIIPKISGKF